MIPADKARLFTAWALSQDADDGIVPEWAKRVNGSPSMVRFKEYTIE